MIERKPITNPIHPNHPWLSNGRTPLEPEQKRSKTICVSLTLTEYENLKLLAKMLHTKHSSLARQLVLNGIKDNRDMLESYRELQKKFTE